ncbi:RluA family pseudouridine synthase [candidate division KSB1 bacterium]|nr:RluA family pseudouridine synthase [candidate division KSB1 bacterium]
MNNRNKILKSDIDTHIHLKVSDHQRRLRIDKYLNLKIEKLSRSRIQKLIDDGDVLVNSQQVKSSQQVNPGDSIDISLPKPRKSEVLPENIPLDIVYEDQHLLVINKEAGMVVHPAYGNKSGTLVNALLHHCRDLSGIGGVERPGIVHRLDKDTSGLLVVAKNDYCHTHLSKQFSERTTEREYYAFVWGHLKKKSDRLESQLSRSKRDRTKMTVTSSGKLAVTTYTVLQEFRVTSLLSLKLGTGRTHQIRVHLKSIGHPIFGDDNYGGRHKQLISLNQNDQKLAIELLRRMPRQALHAKTLGFTHPATSERLKFDSKLPHDMQGFWDYLNEISGN